MTFESRRRRQERQVVTVIGSQVEVIQETMPALADGYARVEIHFAGICHSDIAEIAAGSIAERSYRGHEAAGVIVESRIPALTVGTRVVAYVNDGYATLADAPEDRLVTIEENCSLRDAALAEPVGCVIGAIEMLSLTDRSEIVIVGAGFMGLLAVRYLALLGHAVTVVEVIPARRDLAIAMGAVRALEPDAARDAYPDGTMLVIEATGVSAGLALAGDLVSIAGTLGILGYHQSDGGMRTVPMETWNFRAISVLSLHHRAAQNIIRWIDRAQRSAARGGLVPSALVDAYVGLSDAAEALTSRPASMSPTKAVFDMRAAARKTP